MKTAFSSLFASLCITVSALAQSDFKVEVGTNNTRSDMGLAYNFFTGPDTDDFTTTIKGFGSGFLFDAISGRFSQDVVLIGTDKVNLTLGAGVAITKYRFAESIVFTDDDGVYAYGFDQDPTHEYGEGFFSGDKSKLVLGSFIFPANLNFDVGQFYLSAGGVLDVYVFGKHKRKFTVDGDRQKVVMRNDRFNDFPVNKTKVGLSAMILHKESGISAGVTYMVTPLFEENTLFPELNEVRVSFAYDLSLFDKDND